MLALRLADYRLRFGVVERRDLLELVLPVLHRHGAQHHAGARRREVERDAFPHVRQLREHDVAAAESEALQLCGDRGGGRIQLRIGEPARRPEAQGLPVGGIDHRRAPGVGGERAGEQSAHGLAGPPAEVTVAGDAFSR